MGILDIKKEFKKQLDSLWENTCLHGGIKIREKNGEKLVAFSDIIDRGYAMSTDITTDSLLFVGINPSYRKKDNYGSRFFTLDKYEKDSFFKHFFDIQKETGLNCSYLDMLFIRETNSKIVNALLRDKEAEQFIQAQLAIFKKILEAVNPQVISVNNAMARDFLLQSGIFTFASHSGYQQDKHIKAYTIQNHSILASVNVFFTAMLSGRWADRHMPLTSKQNLVAYIKNAAK